MSWKANCLKELSKAGLFESPDHESRFHELIYCYSESPFLPRDYANVCTYPPGMKSILQAYWK